MARRWLGQEPQGPTWGRDCGPGLLVLQTVKNEKSSIWGLRTKNARFPN